ncbi:putative nucleolus protein [Rosellinia necatrix]|uniref:25S rRNA adenine-N(1) methyltransferase n=1 Tax=Rosellinia necatrix TaxID=77044 RepID=A0A1W2TH78_ROSNE|nr:putative nucleolus protein [Rosellinia necatrix]
MIVKRKKGATKNLARGRPPTVQKPRSISRRATRSLINSIHQLEKKKAQAAAKGDKTAEAAATAEIAALGGIQKYQQASLQGQRNDRGGDSSRVLMEWLKPELSTSGVKPSGSVRMLEIGALSTTNECSRSGFFDMERIDLNSQGEGILQQDFMERPLPSDDTHAFDIISLSLVLNFVPDARGRGGMLLRTLDFLRKPCTTESHDAFPCLFLVLPAPCVTNSRYTDEPLLERIMNALGYVKMRSKITQKLVYYLWKRTLHVPAITPAFKKVEIRPGPTRNNFSIIIDGPKD